MTFCVGLGLIKRSTAAVHFQTGTSDAIHNWGTVLAISAGVVLLGNGIWGIARWVSRWKEEQWKTGKVAGKLIGGGIWRFFVISPIVIISFIFITPIIRIAIANHVVSGRAARLTNSVMQITGDFEAGHLSANQYIRYLVDAAFNQNALPMVYQNDRTVLFPDIIGEIEANLGALDKDTIDYALSALLMTNLEFSSDASSNISSAHGFSSWQPSSAFAKTSNVTTLNKVILSGSKKFLVFYTDTGDDQISDQDAARLATMLDEIINNYQKRLGLTFSSTKIDFLGDPKKIQSVISSNGIEPSHLDTAMPVYVANPFSEPSSTLAFYTGQDFDSTFRKVLISLGAGGDMGAITKSSPVIPFITILPKNIHSPDLALVTAHELAHDYAYNYCKANFHQSCSSHKFISETAANYMAVNVVDHQPSGIDHNTISYHHNIYIRYGHCYSIPNIVKEPPKSGACHEKGSFEGYPTVAYLDNYAEIVPDGKRKIFNALAEDNAFRYLYEQAEPGYNREVLTRLAQRNLTNAYGHKQTLFSEVIPKGEDIPCSIVCTNYYTSNFATTQYFYFPVSEFDHKKVTGRRKAAVDDLIAISVLGRKSGKWELIDSSLPSLDYTIRSSSGYDVIAFAITNYAKEGVSHYAIDITDGELVDIIDPGIDFEATESGYTYGNGCLSFFVSDVFDAVGQAYQMVGQIVDEDTSTIVDSYENQKNQTIAEIGYDPKMTICQIPIKSHISSLEAKNTMHTLMKKSGGFGVSFWEHSSDDGFVKIAGSHNLLSGQTTIFMMLAGSADSTLLSISFE